MDTTKAIENDNDEVGAALWFLALSLIFGYLASTEAQALYYKTFDFPETSNQSLIEIILSSIFAFMALTYFHFMNKLFDSINIYNKWVIFSTNLNEQMRSSLYGIFGGGAASLLFHGMFFSQDDLDLFFIDPYLTGLILFQTAVICTVIYLCNLIYNNHRFYLRDKKKYRGSPDDIEEKDQLTPEKPEPDLAEIIETPEPAWDQLPLIERWQKIRVAFKKLGYDVRTSYEDEKDLLRHNLLLLENNRYTDKVYLDRTVKLYSKILEELKNRDRKLFKKSEKEICKTLTQLSDNLVEHEQKYQKYSLMHLNTTLSAIGKFIKLRQ